MDPIWDVMDKATTLRPVSRCCICQSAFSRRHLPAALSCRHIMGYDCLITWFTAGEGNSDSCPECRGPVRLTLDTERQDVWTALNQEPIPRLVSFCRKLQLGHGIIMDSDWEGNEYIENALEALLSEDHQRDKARPDPFITLRDLFDSNQWVEDLTLEPAFVLAELAFYFGSEFPYADHLYDSDGFALLLWRTVTGLLARVYDTAPDDAPIGIKYGWSELEDAVAAVMTDNKYFDLLHLYTVMISNRLEEVTVIQEMDDKDSKSAVEAVVRLEFFNLEDGSDDGYGFTLEGCPSKDFVHKTTVVFQELLRHQFDKGKPSLRGQRARSIL